MVVVKIYQAKQLMDVKHYNEFRNALAHIGDKTIFNNLPDTLVDSLHTPTIHHLSQTTNGVADDFEFRYRNGITVYVGDVDTEDNISAKNTPQQTIKSNAIRIRLVDDIIENQEYGVLTVYNTTLEDVQQSINDIKNEMYEHNYHDWTITDVINQFPQEWKSTYDPDDTLPTLTI